MNCLFFLALVAICANANFAEVTRALMKRYQAPPFSVIVNGIQSFSSVLWYVSKNHDPNSSEFSKNSCLIARIASGILLNILPLDLAFMPRRSIFSNIATLCFRWQWTVVLGILRKCSHYQHEAHRFLAV